MSKTVVIIINHLREKQVLKILCESYGYDVITLQLDKNTLPQVAQFRPESILLEITNDGKKEMQLLGQLRKSTESRNTRVLCYGDQSNGSFVSEITSHNKTSYYTRPLKTEIIRSLLRPQSGTGASFHHESKELFEGEFELSAEIMDRNRPPTERIQLMKEKIGELLAFPFTVVKVLNVTSSSTTGANDLAQAIEVDPVVVSTVLKVANSALYGRAGKAINSIKDAIVRIGFAETKNIAISLSVMNLFSDEENSIGFDRKEFWYHSLATAVIASHIAKNAGYPKPEIPFVCGLLHDFGIILLDEFFPAFLFTSLRHSTQQGTSFIEGQKELWKICHNDVVVELFKEWNMPEELLLPIQQWSKGFNYNHPTDNSMTLMVHAVRSAEIIAKSFMLGRECDQTVETIPVATLDMLKLTRGITDDFISRVSNNLTIFNSFLQLDRDSFTYPMPIPDSELQGILFFSNSTQTTISPFGYHMEMQNYRCFDIVPAEEILQQESLPDLLLFHCDNESNYDEIFSYAGITVSKPIEGTHDETYEFTIPLLLVVPSEVKDSLQSKLPPSTSILSDTIDLRLITFSIQRLILGYELELAPTEPQSASEQETENNTLEKPKVSTRILNNKEIVLTISGTLTSHYLKELKQIISTLLKKTDTIVFNFTPEYSQPSELISLLDEFRKLLSAKKIILVLCSITEKSHHSDSSILTFKSDTELQTHIQFLRNQL